MQVRAQAWSWQPQALNTREPCNSSIYTVRKVAGLTKSAAQPYCRGARLGPWMARTCQGIRGAGVNGVGGG